MKNAIKNAIQYMSQGYFQLKLYYSIYELYGSYTGCIKKKVIELQRAIIRELLGV
jgi:hypothetical protein